MLLNSRIQNKKDSSVNWETNDPVLLDGEIIIIDDGSGNIRFKVGDGINPYSKLTFQDDLIRTKLENTISINGGAASVLSEVFGEPPYTIEFTEELEEISNVTVAAGNDYDTYRLRNVAILTEAPTVMNDGDIALVISQEG